MKRVTFVEKTAGEVGDGKPHCILATPGQIAELMYRVKDCKFIAGGFTYDDGFGFVTGVSLVAGGYPAEYGTAEIVTVSGTPPAHYDGPNVILRGYVASDYSAILPNVGAPYFGAQYASGDYNFISILDNERGIFISLDDDGSEIYQFWAPTYFVTGMSIFLAGSWSSSASETVHHFQSFSTDTGVDFYQPTPAFSEITGEVAWVDTNGSGNPFDPLNQLWIGIRGFIAHLSTNENDPYFGVGDAAGFNFIWRLESGDLSAPLYMPSGYVITGESDIVLEATEWWPYAKAAGPVWNSATGAKL